MSTDLIKIGFPRMNINKWALADNGFINGWRFPSEILVFRSQTGVFIKLFVVKRVAGKRRKNVDPLHGCLVEMFHLVQLLCYW